MEIQCELIDYAMMKVKCEPGIAAELGEYFTFFVPGYKFMPAFRNKVWDGKIRLFNRSTGELNAGLYAYLSKFCQDRSYSLVTTTTKHGVPLPFENIDTHKFNEFLYSLNLPFMPLEHQYNALIHSLNYTRSVLLSPTGSGKSFIAYLLVQHYLHSYDTGRVLIIVPTTSLVEQLSSDFADYNMDVESTVHKIYSGKDRVTNKRVLISTWQSIYKLPPAWFKQFGMVIGDECHGFKSKSLSSIMNKAVNAKYRFGLTGTLDGTLTHKLVLEGLFGPILKVTSTKKLQDDDVLAPLDIKMLVLNYSEDVRKNFGKQQYKEEIKFIVGHDKRNKFIRNLAVSLEGNTLVLFHRVEAHGKPLFDLINSKVEGNRKVFFVSGDVATSDREAIRRIVEKQKNAIIVASLGTFSTGINIRNLHNIIFASPSKSQIKVLQSIGRGLRKSDDGRVTTLYDIADDLHWEKYQNFALLHSFSRVQIYKNEQFNYKIMKVNI